MRERLNRSFLFFFIFGSLISSFTLAMENNADSPSDGSTGAIKASSVLSSFANFLSRSPDMPSWPTIIVLETGIKIYDPTKIKEEFLPTLKDYDSRQSYIYIPYHKLQKIFRAVGFSEKINGLSTTSYIILHSTELYSMRLKYRAIYNMVAPEGRDPRIPNSLFNSLVDPLTAKVMVNPAMTPEGRTYEREIIEVWLKMTHKDPYSANSMDAEALVENTLLKKAMVAVHNASILHPQKGEFVLGDITPELLENVTQLVAARENNVIDFNAQQFLKALLPYLQTQKHPSVDELIQRINSLHELTLPDHSNDELILADD